jgi:hypothetical protein
MNDNSTTQLNLNRLGGIAGLCVTFFIITFAATSESFGFLFVPEVLSGGSIDHWLANLQANPHLVRLIMLFPILGFSAMLVVGLVLYQSISENSWQKNLAMAAYAIGIPVIVSAFASHGSMINQLLHLPEQYPGMEQEILLHATFGMDHFMLINFAIGPFFAILTANTLMAWAALRSQFLPKWVCYWAFGVAALEVLGIFSLMFPVLGFAQISGPLTMIWFGIVGVILLRRK